MKVWGLWGHEKPKSSLITPNRNITGGRRDVQGFPETFLSRDVPRWTSSILLPSTYGQDIPSLARMSLAVPGHPWS